MKSRASGSINPFIIVSGVLGLFLIGAIGFSVWSYANYSDQKNHVDAKIAAAVTTAKSQQKTDDQKAFDEQEKLPTRQFVGPDDLGRVTFSYPKTWSGYISDDGSRGSSYEAVLQPGVVPPKTQGSSGTTTAYALHVYIDNTSYNDTLRRYQSDIDSGNLKATPVTINGQTGVRLDGKISQTVAGSVVVFKVRDKTLRLATESDTYMSDFNTIILPSLKFNS